MSARDLEEQEELLAAAKKPRLARPARLAAVLLAAAAGLLALTQEALKPRRNEEVLLDPVRLFEERLANGSAVLNEPLERRKTRMSLAPPPSVRDMEELRDYWQRSTMELAADGDNETTTEKYIRVSNCMSQSALVGLKLASAILALEAAVDVCPKVKEFDEGKQPAEVVWKNVTVAGRRLASGVVFGAGVAITSKTQAQQACAANIQGIVSSLAAMAQYIGDSINSCPEYLDTLRRNKAMCTEAIGVLISGATKSSSAASDVQYQCRDPETTAYASPIKKGREQLVTAACVINVGQATSYLANFGLTINDIAKDCRAEDQSDYFKQAACVGAVGSHFADVGQVATYLAAAANGCGKSILNPFGCSNRAAAIVTGLMDIVQGSGQIIQHCVPLRQEGVPTLRPPTVFNWTQ